eukprot:1049033-Rhodomonas_salina.2
MQRRVLPTHSLWNVQYRRDLLPTHSLWNVQYRRDPLRSGPLCNVQWMLGTCTAVSIVTASYGHSIEC